MPQPTGGWIEMLREGGEAIDQGISHYQNLMTGMGRSEALRAVQLEMIRAGGQCSHPYYWVALVLAGDWQPLD